ncbi:hypothetical protein QYE80_32680 [Pseudomonas tohonis]|jgi:hypothetical protein|nr:hypothetical protein [Pseudomonas tohonis]
MEVEMTWHEELPEQCPPADALPLEGFFCFRLCDAAEPNEEDFLSHRQKAPHQRYNAPECIARAVSVFKQRVDAEDLLKLSAHRNKSVVRLKLMSQDGVAKKTGKKSHHSWWRSSLFDISRAVVEEDA